MKLPALFKNKKYRLVFVTTLAVLVMPNFVFAYGMLDFGVMILSLFARLTGWAGIILNLAIMELVFDMGTKLNYSIGASVENAWSIIRDIMNLLFIFSLIYIGFQTILDFGNPRRLLPPLIIAALLINFSLFFTKFIVDVSNTAAVEIYKTVVVPAGVQNPSNPNPKDLEDTFINIGISGAYMQVMGLKDLISPQNNQQNNAGLSYAEHLQDTCASDDDASDCSVTLIVYFLATIIFFLVAAYAFAMGAFMLLWRFIVLIILMIFSPFMFVGMIFPKAGKYQSRWWSTFLNAAFYAPAYMLMLYIGYAIASKINVFDPGDGMFNAVSGKFGSVDLILNFMIVCGFLWASVLIGKEMSYSGSNATMKFADNLRRRGQRALYRTGGFAAGTAMGAGAYGLRTTAGRRAYETANANNETGERLALQAQGTGMKAWYARQRLAANARLAKASFDPRQSMGKNAQKNFGTGKKGGFDQSISDRKKAEESRSKLFGQNDSRVYEDYGVTGLNADYKDKNSKINKLRSQIAQESNAGERKKMTDRLNFLVAETKAMEKGKLYGLDAMKFEDAVKQDGFTFAGNKDQWEKLQKAKQEQYQRFADAKKQEQGYGARQYAENLKNRYTGNKVSRLFGWFYDDPTARRVAAKEITKKNTAKSSGQKIEDIVKELQKEESGGDSTPPAGAATT